MKIYDLHTHTTYSDGPCSVEELLEKTLAAGIDGLGISDHILHGGNNTPESVRRYLDEVGQKPVLLGGELDLGEPLNLTDSDIDRFDYLIASVHTIYEVPGRLPALPLETYFCWSYGSDPDWIRYDRKLAEAYLEQTLRQIEWHLKTYPTPILGHCQAMPFFEDLGWDHPSVISWEKEVVSLCRKYGAAIEISGLWHCPTERMIRLARQEGLRFTFGCDCHEMKDIGDLAYSLDMVNKLSLTQEDLLIPERKRP